METVLAVANDISFNKIFSFQLDNYYTKGDIVIVLSCSGSSPNIMDILNYCKKNKIFSISITGFAKRGAQKKANLNLNLDVKNYGVSEDLFQIIMHMLSQSIRLKFIKNSKKIIL
jgi:D-sedoheptulose 7-phosphate isomerase